MDILILGGPQFLGRAMIDASLAAGHNVTVFNRGQTNPDLYPEIEKLRGDRDGDLGALSGRRWDAVIDNSGYVPRIVRQSAEALVDSAGRYVFISTISVYRDLTQAGLNEEGALGTLSDESVEEVNGETYGPLKVLCERAVQDIHGDRATIIRPGLIVGPHDHTHRFTYWVTRPARGGEMLAPSGPDYKLQVIDVRDLAEWTLRMIAADRGGIYNATGPDYELKLGKVLETARKVSGSDAAFSWASEGFLLQNKVAPWSDLPLWIPDAMKIHHVNVSRALSAGLTFRPIEDTIRDTLAWAKTQPAPDTPPGLSPEREGELLEALRSA
jgi:2'-hydroxyisoflavone reductase